MPVTRLGPDVAPEPAPRRLLYQLIERQPGVPLTRVAAQFPHGYSSLYHHLGHLEVQGKVKSRRAGRMRLLYPVKRGVLIPRRATPPSAGLRETAARVARHIIQNPGRMTPRALMTRLGLPMRITYHHVANLVRDGYVASSSATRYRDLRPTPKLLRAMGPEKRR